MPESPLKTFKPDFDEAARRWAAYHSGEIVDRPVVCVTAPAEGMQPPEPISYREKVFGDLDAVVERGLENARRTFWGGEAMPSFYPSFGPDEIAVFTGAQLHWSKDSDHTNWSVPYIENWAEALPIKLHADHPLFQRQVELYRRAALRYGGSVLLVLPDLHTNMDLLSAARGPERLCLDLIECPEMIDQAMEDSRAIFRELWVALTQAGRMYEHGFCLESHALYSPDGAATLQCDFSIMIRPAMFRRWVLPALEEEAALARHVVYHWDGPGALVHMADLLACPGLQTLSFVPGAGNGEPVNYIELLQKLQAAGKSVHVWGTPDECKTMHRSLKPEKVFYCTSTSTQSEAEELLGWFKRNT